MAKFSILIDDMQNDIFTYCLGDFSSKMLSLIEVLTAGAKIQTGFNRKGLNEVLNKMLASYEKKDYLLLADLLEFELKPLLSGPEWEQLT